MKAIDLIIKILRRVPKGHKLYYGIIQIIPVKKEKVLSELDGSFFLITSTGRTGTALFANILNATGEAEVVHEPIIDEQYFHRLTLESPSYSRNYLREFRLKEVFLRKNKKIYGEVNSALRGTVQDLTELLPNTPTIHIVRNGYDVVSSILNRNTFTDLDKYYRDLIPHESMISKFEWLRLSRFEKICFMWAEENRRLSRSCDVTAKFEDLISNYEYFNSYISDHVGIKVSKEVLDKYTESKINASKCYIDSNRPEAWTEEQYQAFERICGEQMAYYGYKKKR